MISIATMTAGMPTSTTAAMPTTAGMPTSTEAGMPITKRIVQKDEEVKLAVNSEG